MSIEMMNSVFKSRGLNLGEKMVLLALADRADDDGVCWPSVEGLRLKTGIGSYSTLNKYLWILKDSGLITITQRSDTREGRKTNLYKINHSRLHTNEISRHIRLSREQFKIQNPKITDVSNFLKSKGLTAPKLQAGVANTLIPGQSKVFDLKSETNLIVNELQKEYSNEN